MSESIELTKALAKAKQKANNLDCNVAEVVAAENCIGCGICKQVCPSAAINLVYNSKSGVFNPEINLEQCSACGLCRKVCYALSPNYICGNSVNMSDKSHIIGTYIDCYIGFAVDQNTRFNATSGGAVTAILEFLFDERQIEGAIVAGLFPGDPLQAKAFIAKNKEEVKLAMGSKYCPVLLSEAIASITEGKNYAFVGLPCQIFGIKQLGKYNKALQNSIRVYIGLMCGGTFSNNGTEYLLNELGFKDQPIRSLSYREKGWPGKMIIKTGTAIFTVPHLSYWSLISPWFYLNTCFTCLAGLSYQADIVCGDAWLPEIMKNDEKGTSIIVSRTSLGDLILSQSLEKCYLSIRKINVNYLLKCQRSMISFKHLSFETRLRVLQLFRKKVYAKSAKRRNRVQIKPAVFLDELFISAGRFLASHRRLWNLFTLYRTLFKQLHG